jgi:hypothetical protein
MPLFFDLYFGMLYLKPELPARWLGRCRPSGSTKCFSGKTGRGHWRERRSAAVRPVSVAAMVLDGAFDHPGDGVGRKAFLVIIDNQDVASQYAR